MIVVVGSKNPVKGEAVKAAFAAMFPEQHGTFELCEAISGVPDQPFGSEETKRGATNRALECKRIYPDADFWVGLEGGLEASDDELWAMAWMCVIGKTGARGYGKTSAFLLPPALTHLIHEGKELGEASDVIFQELNSKQKGGTVGILTNGVITRKEFYKEALILALIPFLQTQLY